MVKYKLCNNGILLYEGYCDTNRLEEIKAKYSLGNYKIKIVA